MDAWSDTIRNEHIRWTMREAHACKRITDRRVNWYGHVMRRDEEHTLRESDKNGYQGKTVLWFWLTRKTNIKQTINQRKTGWHQIDVLIISYTCTDTQTHEWTLRLILMQMDTQPIFFFFFSILCRAAFNAAYSHTGGQARELVRS